MVWAESFSFAITVVQETLVVPSLYVFVEFSEEENTEEFWSVVRVTLPEPVRPETVTVKGIPFMTLPESAPNCETETVSVAETGKTISINEKTNATAAIFIIFKSP